MFVKDKTGNIIPQNHVRKIQENLRQGVEYPYCSPMFDITREQAATILINTVTK